MVSFRRALGLFLRPNSVVTSPVPAAPAAPGPGEDVLRKPGLVVALSKEGADPTLTERCLPPSASRRDAPAEQRHAVGAIQSYAVLGSL